MTFYDELLARLEATQVEFILVGGVAATAHGSTRVTLDLDILYSREPENLDRIVAALADLNPYLRGAPPGLPFRFEPRTLAAGLNFTLTTDRGDLDLLGVISGLGTFAEVLPESVEIEAFGRPLRCLSLDQLLQAKRAAGRPKDFEVIAELEEIRDELG